jgi:outer membrane translocation and assembly module TamA
MRGVLAVRLTGGTISRLGGTVDVPNFERYFAGGANSVRGWSLNRLGPKDVEDIPVGGLSLFEGSVEIRHRLIWSLGSAVFVDAGRIGEGRTEAFRPDRLGWSAGFGIRYLTAIGPIRFDVARRLSEDPDEDRTQIYLSLGQAF